MMSVAPAQSANGNEPVPASRNRKRNSLSAPVQCASPPHQSEAADRMHTITHRHPGLTRDLNDGAVRRWWCFRDPIRFRGATASAARRSRGGSLACGCDASEIEFVAERASRLQQGRYRGADQRLGHACRGAGDGDRGACWLAGEGGGDATYADFLLLLVYGVAVFANAAELLLHGFERRDRVHGLSREAGAADDLAGAVGPHGGEHRLADRGGGHAGAAPDFRA